MSPCYRPIPAFRRGDGSVSFSESADDVSSLRVRCGRCVGCRMITARSWAIRCWHESLLHDVSSFVTLTYNDDNCDSEKSLDHRDCQLFIKRLRKRCDVRFFLCGEYGPRTLRPHYHALLFGVSPELPLEDIWGLGFVTSELVTPARVSYVTGYVIKDSPVPKGRRKPYRQMSRRPGIGADFFERYRGDFRKDFAVWCGKEVALPVYYRRRMDPELLEELDFARFSRRFDNIDETVDRMRPEREKVAELVAEARVDTFQERNAI